MFRIRRIHDDVLPANREVISRVQQILRERFSAVPEEEITAIGEKLRNPFKQRFRSILFVAEKGNGRVLGFALLLHEPEIGFAYLDWIAMATDRGGGGMGAALYERVRQEALALKAGGLFFECLPDDPEQEPDEKTLNENKSRLKFYERFGARPLTGTAYETPVKEGDRGMPYLVYDSLGTGDPPERDFARQVVRAILERKYAHLCPPDYVTRVVESFQDSPLRLREPRYIPVEKIVAGVPPRSGEAIALVVNDRHDIHHVHEHGYVEAPVRIPVIMKELTASNLFVTVEPHHFADRHLNAVHAVELVRYLKKACAGAPEKKSIYPYVFPIRNQKKPPRDMSVLAGYYCIDTFTPIHRNAYPAARRAIDCALTAAREILAGRRLAYALVRPPGHHAEHRSFGGFCYFNQCAVAAHYLSLQGKVAILDIDYHHGNGQQDIFYRRSDVLTLSIHGHPSFAYPYFSGFSDELGEGEGEGFNQNFPLKEHTTPDDYRKTLADALQRIREYEPEFLVVALGLDPAKGDPTGTWALRGKDFDRNGEMIGELGLPTLVIQEGGYLTRTLGKNARAFFQGLSRGVESRLDGRTPPRSALTGLRLRQSVSAEDAERVRRLADATEMFNRNEVDMAAELVRECIAKGEENSGYQFLFAEHHGRLTGFACWGRIPCTQSSYDLYWLAVHPDEMGRGIGQQLLDAVQQQIRKSGGSRLYVETSHRARYAASRNFYERNEFTLESVLEDFYAPGEGKVIYSKSL